MKIATFLFINFMVAFFSDIILNDLSIPALQPYFKNASIIKSALIAGVTIEIALIISLAIYFIVMNNVMNKFNIIYFCIIAFIVGFILDKLIERYKSNLFGTKLDLYYKQYGSGLWGAGALLFSIVISYFIQIRILPIL